MEMKSPPAKGHRQRLRDKFLRSGFAGFHDYEILELLLTLGTPRKDCKPMAKALLERFKTFQGVMDASPGELTRIKGIGPRNLFGLKLAKAVSERYVEERMRSGDFIKNAVDLLRFLSLTIRDKGREAFRVIYLDAKNRVLSTEVLFEGTLTASAVYPREVVRSALDHHAAAVIFAHNHPSGDPNPSPEDCTVTRDLVFACRMVGVIVHEHIVIGNNTYYSFADKGLIKTYLEEYKAIHG